MDIKVFNTAVEASEFVAKRLLDLITAKSSAKLGVATGRTMDAIYHRFVGLAQQMQLDLSQVKAFAVDEYMGLEPNSPNSYRAYLDLHLFNKLNFKPENLFVPDISKADIDAIGIEYEALIKKAMGIDFQLLGIGLNGHIGLNEPGSSLDSRTRIVALTGSTMRSNKVLFKNEGMPLTAITMGIGTILDAKQCCMVATGETKAEIVQKVVNGDISSKIPASALKQHPHAMLVLDKDAASLI